MESKTNKIQKLLQSLCPNGVEWKTLGEVCELNNFKQIGAIDIELLKKDNCENQVKLLPSSKNYDWWSDKESCGEFLCNGEIMTLGRARYANLKYHKGDFVSSNNIIIQAKSVINGRFLYHLINNNIKKFYVETSTYPKFDNNIFKSFKIPIPPLEVQQEIVRILDKFTELEKELEKELEARKKQYAYYRENLLSLEYLVIKNSGVKLVSLGEIGTFIRGNGLQKSDFVDSGIPCIHYGEIHTYYKTFAHHTKSFVSAKIAEKLKKAQYGNLIIAGVSENKEDACKAVVYLGKDDVCISGDSFAFSHSQNPKFIGYMLQTQAFSEYKQKYTYGTKVMRMHIDKLKQFKIPIPSLEVQQEIVRILDKFEDLTQNLQQGLPAEIQARKKQYEYYREMLLSF